MKKTFLIIVFSLFNLPTSAQTIQDTLLVGYTTAPPFIIQEGELLEGINIWLWERIAADLSLNYKLVPMKFGEMLDALKNDEIDVSINPLSIQIHTMPHILQSVFQRLRSLKNLQVF